MMYRSTRGITASVGFGAALRQGLAQDGGLYVPSEWPAFTPADFGSLETLPDIGTRLMAPFVANDALAPQLESIARRALNFPAPVLPLSGDGRYSVLELFHGPTAAFKDFGARFLAACFERLRRPGDCPVNVLVATSGDTGGAVAAAFHRLPGFAVTVLYPKGLVSPTQERQLTCWGDNVTSLSVQGTFDDCQQLVKQAFLDASMLARQELTSANSINLGRLLPQMVYYAAASLACHRRHGEPLSFIIPAGNLGNTVACVWARRCGLPIGEVMLAHNANRTVPDFLASGEWHPRASVATLASAMDVGDPSNMERLRSLHPTLGDLRQAVRTCSVDDDAIRARIRADHAAYGRAWCPHTAVAAEAYTRLSEAERRGQRWCIVSTAHPAKFAEIVQPLIGRPVEMPASLGELFRRERRSVEIEASLPALRAAIES
ncbi:MAG: threonine synthase [Gemmatimonas sp.]|nr:threonine synthase [Gemmatimonas sp.]